MLWRMFSNAYLYEGLPSMARFANTATHLVDAAYPFGHNVGAGPS